jgi:hypothetical protein
MTKTKRIHQKIKLKSDKSAQYNKAAKDFERDKFKVSDCVQISINFLDPLSIDLSAMETSSRALVQHCLTLEEEKVILSHVKWRSPGKFDCYEDGQS